jgi:hypothetical protein
MNSLDSSVSIVTRLRNGISKVRVSIPGRVKRFSLLQSVTNISGTHQAPCWGEVLIPGIKRQECEVDHSRPYSAEVKNEWSNTSNFNIYSYHTLGQLYLYFTFIFISVFYYAFIFYIIIVSLWNRVRIITATVTTEVKSHNHLSYLYEVIAYPVHLTADSMN